jgi:hypothetical protein
MDEVIPCSFKIRLQNPSGKSLEARDVHCVVVEEGSWTMPDGRKIEAKMYESKLTDYKSSWVPHEEQTYTNSYSNPIVLGQVMSYNDAKRSVFWSRGSASNRAPRSGSKLFTGKHVGEDSAHNRDPVTIGYIVIEKGHATSNGIKIETKRGFDLAVLYVQGFSKKYTYSTPFSTTPAVAVLSQVAMDGGDVSWDVLAEVTLQNSMKVAVDEDHLADGDNSHTYKQLDYIVFSTTGPLPLV